MDRIIELSWQPANWILFKTGEGGRSVQKLEGYNSDNICQKWEICHFKDIHRYALTAGNLFAKGDSIKHMLRWSDIPCIIRVIVERDTRSMNHWMQAIKREIITLYFNFKTKTLCLYVISCDINPFSSSIFLSSVSLWRQAFKSLLRWGLHAVSGDQNQVTDLKAPWVLCQSCHPKRCAGPCGR